MNVSESIDWRHVQHPWELDLHRFIATTNSGQTLDGYLRYRPYEGGHGYTICDSDDMTVVFRSDFHTKQIALNKSMFKAINVLEEHK